MNKRISLHISFWILYILLKTYLNFEAGSAGNTQNATLSYFILSLKAQLPFLAVKIPLVYSLFNLSEQYLNGNKNLIQISAISILLFLISIVCFLFISNLIVLKYIYQVPSDLKSAFSPGSIIYTFFNLAFVSGIALALKLVRANLRQKENEQEIIKKKLETELQFLKAQTNPHFLFNTLNNIYALARKKSDDTPDVVMKLSKLLRFMLYESQKESIPINDEVQMLDNYIELEKIRHSSNLKLTFVKSIDNELQQMAPLILLPFVENAFKHGAGESRFGAEIDIFLKLEQGQLQFSVTNTISGEKPVFDSERLGLNNIKRQLELIYPEHHLHIDSNETHFNINLKTNLYKYVKL